MNVSHIMPPPYLESVAHELDDAHPQDILRWAHDSYGERLAVVTSFQVTGIVTLHMLANIAPDIAVITLDTGLLFPETEALIERITADWRLNLIRLKPEQTVTQQAQTHGNELWARDPDKCCYLRKALPLKRELSHYDAWITGLRRDQSPARANTPVVGWDRRHDMIKLAPFATWTEDMLWAYVEAYELPYNELHDRGYPSIGCVPCTRAVAAGEDARAGRWAGTGKVECGIHVQPEGKSL